MKTNNTKTGTNPAKTMQEIENQVYRLSMLNWSRRGNVSKVAKNSRDALICKAYLNDAAKHLAIKARSINKNLTVRPLHDCFYVALEYCSPSVGFTLKLASPFEIESFLGNPVQVTEMIYG